MRIPRSSLVALLVLGSVTASLSLTGCVADLIGGAVQDQLEQAIEEETGGEVSLGGGGGDSGERTTEDLVGVPSAWPDSVSLPPGARIQSWSDDGSVSLTTMVYDKQEVLDHIDALVDDGFTIDSETSSVIGGGWVLSKGETTVVYMLIDYEPEDDELVITMSVTENSE